MDNLLAKLLASILLIINETEEINMTRVIAVANQKGGVGKTTTTESLGIGLVQQGKRVLLVDADPQGSLTIGLGYREPDQIQTSMFELMQAAIEDSGTTDLREATLHHTEGVDLLPANIRLAAMEMQLLNVMMPCNSTACLAI